MPEQLIDVGSRRQLLFDDFFLARQERITLTLHRPELRETVIACDRPWEQGHLHYSSVLLDEGRYRMWYRVDADNIDRSDYKSWVCYAESSDGIRWEKPDLGLVEWHGNRQNNILFPNETVQGINATVIKDMNAPAGERYKLVIRGGKSPTDSVLGFLSDDGLRWRPVETNPLLTDSPFDTHASLLWDDERQVYAIYTRGIDLSVPGPFKGGRRAIRRAESPDFRRWTKPELIVWPDGDDPANLHFYTNAAVKYDRAARAFFLFPMVLYPDRQYPGAPEPGLSDVHFLASRDGIHWDRRFRQPYIAPGLDGRNWVDRNPIMGVGIVPTGPTELSLYYSDLYRAPESRLRRATVRPDGFVSVAGPYTGWGEFTTHPIVFGGRRLEMNYSTGGGGSVFVELQAADGSPLPGFGLHDCVEIVGDKVDGIVRWQQGDDVGSLAGQAVRLRVRLRDAHLFAFRFQA